MMAGQQTPNHPAYELLARAHDPEAALSILVDKVNHKPLNLRPTSSDPSSQDARAARRLQRLRKKEHATKRSKPKRLSARKKKALGLYDIPRSQQNYQLFVPLHRMWLGYIREILHIKKGEQNYVTAAASGSILASADYHGAELEVVRSRCVSRVGCKGIVVKDNKFTFELVTRSNVLKVIPKEHSLFRFEISLWDNDLPTDSVGQMEAEKVPEHPSLVFELHGDQFEARAPDRATKKFKQRRMDDL